MSFFEFFEEVEKEFFDYLEYLEVNDLEFNEYGNVVKKNLTLSFKTRNYSDDYE